MYYIHSCYAPFVITGWHTICIVMSMSQTILCWDAYYSLLNACYCAGISLLRQQRRCWRNGAHTFALLIHLWWMHLTCWNCSYPQLDLYTDMTECIGMSLHYLAARTHSVVWLSILHDTSQLPRVCLLILHLLLLASNSSQTVGNCYDGNCVVF